MTPATTTGQALARRDELVQQLARVREDRAGLQQHHDAIRAAEMPNSSPGRKLVPAKAQAALAAARVANARGEASDEDVQSAAAAVAELDGDIARLESSADDLRRAERQIKQELTALHRSEFGAFAEEAERQVAELEDKLEQLLPALAEYNAAWNTAVATWRDPCNDFEIPGAPPCPLPGPHAIATARPRPPYIPGAGEQPTAALKQQRDRAALTARQEAKQQGRKLRLFR